MLATGTFVVEIDAPQFLFEDQEITFNCSAGGINVVGYNWSRDETVIGSDAELTVTVLLSWNGSCLTCQAEADNGDTFNASTTLQVFSKILAS